MSDWTWTDPDWRERVGEDADRAAREAVRRAVDLRDALADAGRDEANRAVFLVSVLNHLTELLALDTSALWDRT